MMEHLKFAGKVALVILLINQIGPIRDAVSKQYFGGGSA
jgi:hypothetical protein